MTWLSSIEFINFKSYTKQKLTFPAPTTDNNIVLIGGVNGAGKTSFLEGLYLCLYGKEALPRLALAGVQTGKETDYSDFLNTVLNKKIASDNRSSKMSVQLTWHHDARHAFELKRTWSFNAKGLYNSTEDNLQFSQYYDGNKQPINSGELGEYLHSYFVPANQAEFFFFDGEKVKGMLATGLNGSLMNGISSLLGVDLLQRLIESLKKYKSSKTRQLFPEGKGKVDKVDYESKENQLQTLAKRIKTLTDQCSDINHQLEEQKNCEKSCTAEWLKMGGGSASVETSIELTQQKSAKATELKNLEANLISMLTDKLPFMLMGGYDLCEEIKQQLNAENEQLRLDSHKKDAEPRKQLFLEYFLEELDSFEPKLTAKQIKSLDLKATASWERLHYPVNKGEDTKIIHVQFGDSEGVRKQTCEWIDNTIGLGLGELGKNQTHKATVEAELDDITRRLNNIQSTGSSERISEINAELENTRKNIEALSIQKGSKERELLTEISNHNDLEAIVQRLQNQSRNAAGDNGLLEKTDKITELLKTLTQLNVDSLYAQKIRQISEAATQAHYTLALKKQVESIDIELSLDKSGQTKANLLVKDTRNEAITITQQLSAGEQQILATALLAGLAHAASTSVPFITDTPVGRLCVEHRKNLLDFWTTQHTSRQIIILSQDTEITSQVYQDIQSKVSKTFLLRNEKNDYGYYETTVQENTYFK